MNMLRLLFVGGSLVAIGCALAATNELIVIGTGADKLGTNTVQHISEVVRAVAGVETRLWMLDCDAYQGGGDDGRVFRAMAYFRPRVFARVVRCEGVFVADDSMKQFRKIEFPSFGGWFSTDTKPRSFAFVSLNLPLRDTNAAPQRPFGLSGEISDSDIVSMANAVRREGMVEPMQSMSLVTNNTICVWTGDHRSGKSYESYWQKVDGEWKKQWQRKWLE